MAGGPLVERLKLAVVSVNPIPEAGNNVFIDPQNPLSIIKGGEKLTDLYLQVKINGDVALLKAKCAWSNLT